MGAVIQVILGSKTLPNNTAKFRIFLKLLIGFSKTSLTHPKLVSSFWNYISVVTQNNTDYSLHSPNLFISKS